MDEITTQQTIENPYLIFETEQEAEVALELIYANMVAAIDVPALLDVIIDEEIPQAELTDNERSEYTQENRRFPIFGVNAKTGLKNKDEGHTTSWALARKTINNKWVFPKPVDTFLEGISNYIVESYNSEWFPQTTSESEIAPAYAL